MSNLYEDFADIAQLRNRSRQPSKINGKRNQRSTLARMLAFACTSFFFARLNEFFLGELRSPRSLRPDSQPHSAPHSHRRAAARAPTQRYVYVSDQRPHVDTQVRFFSEVPAVSYFRLLHFRTTLAVAVLGRVEEGAAINVASTMVRASRDLCTKVTVDFIEDPARQIVIFKQTAELQQDCYIRSRLVRPIDADESVNRLPVVDRIFCALVRQPWLYWAMYMRSIRYWPVGGRRGCRPSGRTASEPPPTQALALPPRSRTENGRAVSDTFCWQTRRRKRSIAS